ncbi:MAG TPA: S9 family peptidase, partial [Chloroflexota bacterium]|nr:S9 family peptidase [Chloroflexota bacterium]
MADQSGSAKRRSVELGDLTRLRGVSDPRISPDGRRIAFVVETIVLEANQTRSQIWLADDGDDPRPLTSGEHKDSQPRWSPVGNELAFVSNRSGRDQVWLLPLSGGEPRQLTSHPIGAEDPAWSPDGRKIAFLGKGTDRRGETFEPDSTDDRSRLVWVREHRHKLDGTGYAGSHRTHLWIISIGTGPAAQLTDGPFDDADAAWSPDGREIAFVSDRSQERDWHFGGGAVHLVDVASGQVRRLTSETEGAAHPSWSPDGARLAYVAAAGMGAASSENFRLWTRGVDGGDARCLTADLDLSVGQRPGGYLTPSPPAWNADGSALLYLIGAGPSTHLFHISDRERVGLTGGRGAVLSFSAVRSGNRAAFLRTDPVTPPEVWLWDATSGTHRVSAINRDLLDELELASPIDLKLSRPNGTEVEAWLLAPPFPSVGAIPLILSVHGGPHNYFGDTFSFDHQLFAALGYAVLYGNPRGSGGYGEKFAGAVCEDWGGEDFGDQMALLDLAIARADPRIDPMRLAITGGSYGGFMTCWAVTQTDRFAVGV